MSVALEVYFHTKGHMSETILFLEQIECHLLIKQTGNSLCSIYI